MKIVLDTNVIMGDKKIDDFWFKRKDLQDLLAYADATGIQIVIPKLVILELEKHYREVVKDTRDKLLEKTAELRCCPELKELELSIPEIDLTKVGNAYRKWLEEGKIENLKIEIPEFTILKVEDLVLEAIDNRKPGKECIHLKDQVIWHAVKELAKVSEICLITSNYSDFAEGKSQKERLHPSLRRQIKDCVGEVKLYSDTGSFLSTVSTELPELTIDWLKEQSYFDNLKEIIEVQIHEVVNEVAGSFSTVVGLISTKIWDLETEPRYIFARTLSDKSISVTVWFISQFNVQHLGRPSLQETLSLKPFKIDERRFIRTLVSVELTEDKEFKECQSVFVQTGLLS